MEKVKKCSVFWCDRPVDSPRDKYCDIHGYGKKCQIIGCDKRASRNYSLCYKHYEQYKQTFKNKPNTYQRFLKHIEIEGDCWLWVGHIENNGYGLFWDGCGPVFAHRYSYEIVHGITRSRIYHLCKNRNCCNPDHLTLENPRKRSILEF